MIEEGTQSVVNRVQRTRAVRPGENHIVDIEIHRVAMVVTGLLKVDTVGSHMNWKLLQKDPLTRLSPAFRILEFRQQCAQVKKAERLPGQVSVGTEISGEICFQVPAVQI